MKSFKKALLPLLLVVALFATSLTAFAADSPTGKVLGSVKLEKSVYTYQNTYFRPGVTVYAKDGTELVKDKDYTVRYWHNRKAGTAKVIIEGIGVYAGSKIKTPFTIKKAKAYARIDKKTTVKLKRSAKRQIKFYLVKDCSKNASVKFTKRSTYISSSSKNVKVSKSGVVKIAKNAKAGTYTIKIKMPAVSSNYKAVTRTITVIVK